ncbi:MAG: hypothetical protein ACRD1X_01655 [Vicinamibacteria bacterium]
MPVETPSAETLRRELGVASAMMLGLGACLFLAFWVERSVWLTGLLVLGIGLLWHAGSRRLRSGVRASLDPD